MEKPLSKKEKFVCELTWGNIPVEINWARSSPLFNAKIKEFETGKYKELYEYENKSQNIDSQREKN